MDVNSNMLRTEKVLILPYNTLRFVDAAVQADINKILPEDRQETDYYKMLYRLACRINKSLGKFNGVDEELVDQLIKENIATYYKYSPRTKLLDSMVILADQSFVTGVDVLYDNADIPNDCEKFNKLVYDGSYEQLAKIIRDGKYTCYVMSDIELVDKLTADKSLSFEDTSFIISKLGYNYNLDKETGSHILKNIDEIEKRYYMELSEYSLLGFPKETIDFFNHKKQ